MTQARGAKIRGGSAAGVLDEVVEAVVRREAGAAVPAAADVATDRALAVVGGARRAVPQVRVVEQHVAALAVEGDLAGHVLEPERHLVGTTAMGAGQHTEEPVAG